MAPALALALTVAFTVFLFYRDMRERPGVTAALWVPLVWFLLSASRPASDWLGIGGGWNSVSGLEEGSFWDRTILLTLQIVGILILIKRQVPWSAVFSRNVALTVFLVYCGLSVLWSDFPFPAFKRWFKHLGLPIMVLILATEPDGREAQIRLMKRAAYVLVPFSILLIKYYPHLGRDFSVWSGAASNHGVTTNKNELGYVCLILGLFFFWHLLTTLRREKGPARRQEILLTIAFLCMIGWLLYMAGSATSSLALVLGVTILLFLGLRFVNPRYAPAYLGSVVAIYVCTEFFFGLTDALVATAGRDPTLSGRRELWDRLRLFDSNPLIGVGFESFWFGERLEALWSEYWWRPNQAHNGYLETYLNLGWIGLILLASWILSAFKKAQSSIRSDFDFGRFQFAALTIMLIYNYTEAAFKGIHPLMLLFYMVAIEYPRIQSRSIESVTGRRSQLLNDSIHRRAAQRHGSPALQSLRTGGHP